MEMKKFNLLNTVTGWAVFLIAATTYLLTIEPTASLWDCGEFIATAFKLEVGHPPGAPLFMIMARFFSLFAGDVTKIAMMVNAMSALASAFTILFLFWSITHLARRILIKVDKDFNLPNIITILGAGSVGALAYTFSDTFWFSAVEGEVYASSSLFTALVFWAILKWENVADEKYANRWIILIAFLMGLSIGVHLLNLLAIPALVFVYYFKKYPVTPKGVIYTTIISIALLASIMYVIIPGTVSIAALFERIFINGFGMPYNSGIIIYGLLLVGALCYGIYSTSKKKQVIANTILTGIAVILIGYSSFTMIVIRALADPPLDENNPENVFSLLKYLNREQYGDRPLLFGPYYNAPIVDYKETSPTYTKQDGKYVITNYSMDYKYDKRFTTFFPRMYSREPAHINVYKQWAGIKGEPIKISNSKGDKVTEYKPTFSENIVFFIKYQMGFMYWRYFMWNFAGKQNDVQSYGGILNGNWITGINFIDNKLVGPQDTLPPSLKNTKSRNVYYMLPLFLGLLGLFFHFNNDKKNALVVTLLFIMTGLAIVVYLNQTPNQPRERDYAYAGSFYAFTIWIGLGILGLVDITRKYLKEISSPVIMTLLGLILVPGIMAKENWDDHDRSGRYLTKDYAYNYLNSCAPNAILMTNGDNDTFPLWYLQEVEGVRTDVRVMNLMLLNGSWYIDQMGRKAYESDPLPFSLTPDKYIDGKRDVIYLLDRMKERVDLKDAIDFVASDDKKTKFNSQGQWIDYIPTHYFSIEVDSAIVIKNGTVLPEEADKIEKYVEINLNRSNIRKSDLMVLDLLANNNWDRPIYFLAGGSSGSLGLEKYFRMEGFAYRLTPVAGGGTSYPEYGRVATDILYDNLMNKFKFDGLKDPDVYLDFFHTRTFAILKFRNTFVRLANALIDEGKRDSALQVLDRCMDLAPNSRLPYDQFTIDIVDSYFRLSRFDKGNAIINEYAGILNAELTYYYSLNKSMAKSVEQEIRMNLYLLQLLQRTAQTYNQTSTANSITNMLTKYLGSTLLGK